MKVKYRPCEIAGLNVARLINLLLRLGPDGSDQWRSECVIETDYQNVGGAQFRVVVRCGEWFLRHSKGPRQGWGWDCYPDDLQNVELALIALSEASPPPNLIVKELYRSVPMYGFGAALF